MRARKQFAIRRIWKLFLRHTVGCRLRVDDSRNSQLSADTLLGSTKLGTQRKCRVERECTVP